MKDWLFPDDAVCPDEPTCMWCGKICDKVEFMWTGDSKSYKGFEMWCYCDECKTDTFHKLIKKTNESSNISNRKT